MPRTQTRSTTRRGTAPEPAPRPPRYASFEEAAEYLRVNPKTVRRYVASGRLTGYRVGERLLRVDLNEVDALLRPIPTGGIF